MMQKLISNRYEIKHQLGKGGQATVFLAYDREQGKDVALKLLSEEMTKNPKHIKRFHREFAVCKKLENRNIIKLYDSGFHEKAGYFYTMEYLPYPTVDDKVKAKGPLDHFEVANMLMQLSKGLEAIHKDGIIHRDIKPENVIVTPDNRYVLVDFGLAKATGSTALTATGAVLGTPYLMSPEMILGENVDLRADIYSLGILSFYSITGKYPYTGKGLMNILSAISCPEPVPLVTKYLTTIPERLSKTIEKSMTKDPDMRFQNCKELQQALHGRKKHTTVKSTPIKNTPIKSTPVKGKGNTHKRNVIIGLVFFTILAAIIATSLMTNNVDIKYTCTNLELVSEPQWIYVKWNSLHRYKSIVTTILPEKMQFSGDNGKAVTNHTVPIGPFTNDMLCNFTIAYPDGTSSLTQSKRTRRIKITPSSNTQNLNIFSITSPAASLVTLKIESVSGSEYSYNGQKQGERWFFKPNDTDLSIKETSLILQYPSGEETILNLAEITMEQLLSTSGKLTDLDFKELESTGHKKLDKVYEQILARELKKLGKTNANNLTRFEFGTVREKATGYIIPALDSEFEISETFDSLLPWFSLIFENNLFSLSHREKAYKIFSRAIEISVFTAAMGANPPLRFIRMPRSMGPFSTIFVEELFISQATVLFEASRKKPCQLYPKVQNIWNKGQSFIKTTANIDNRADIEAAEIIFNLKAFKYVLLNIIVNDREKLVTYCHPYCDVQGKEKIFITQRIPVQYLKNKENKIEITAVQPVITLKSESVPIMKIWLNLVKKN